MNENTTLSGSNYSFFSNLLTCTSCDVSSENLVLHQDDDPKLMNFLILNTRLLEYILTSDQENANVKHFRNFKKRQLVLELRYDRTLYIFPAC